MVSRSGVWPPRLGEGWQAFGVGEPTGSREPSRPGPLGRPGRPRRSAACPGRRSHAPRAATTSAAPGTSRRTRRIAPINWVTVSWVATASSRIVESSVRRDRPRSTPVSATTALTASKIRFGRSVARRQAAPPVGQRRRVERARGDRQADRGLPPQVERDRLRGFPVRQVMQRLQHQDRGDHVAGTLGRPRRDGNRSANITSGNNSARLSVPNPRAHDSSC
jgi:hypothetical protein